MISTRDLSRLPEITPLRRNLQSMAMLDAILSPNFQFRYYSFNARWSDDEQMASMRDGSGDEIFALFNAAGCWLKGFAHEAPMSPYRDDGTKQIWPGVMDEVPTEFVACLREPAFATEDTTFCIWRKYGDASWLRGQVVFPIGQHDPDGSEELLSRLDGEPGSYRDWAEAYYERVVDLKAVRHIFDQRPLAEGLVSLLNPEIGLRELNPDITEIGYPARVDTA